MEINKERARYERRQKIKMQSAKTDKSMNLIINEILKEIIK